MQEGQRLERFLQEQKGLELKEPVVFGSTNEVIVEAGKTVAASQISKVQKYVKEQLENLEFELKDRKLRELEQLKMDHAQIKAEADEQMTGMRTKLEDQSSDSKNANSRQRDELLELRPFTFLGEIRYRELKSRWGQVFRADMGAEAFYDILRRLDLDKLSQELWPLPG
jgi:DNA-directed RNA polymerase subunit beta'